MLCNHLREIYLQLKILINEKTHGLINKKFWKKKGVDYDFLMYDGDFNDAIRKFLATQNDNKYYLS